MNSGGVAMATTSNVGQARTEDHSSKPGIRADQTNPLHRGLRQQLVQRHEKLEEAISRRSTATLVRLLEEVDAALSRCDGDAFGICEACHDSIETERLVADPLVRFCVDHLPEAQRRALEDDLELAAKLQARLLPKRNLECEGWRVAYHYQPAALVSGDYCDLLTGPDGSLYFVLGDVSGKGVAASMLMGNLSAMFRALVPLGVGLAEIVAHANRSFCESTLPSQFATLICGKATGSGEVEICNAGHLEPLVFRADSVQSVESSGLPIGLFREQAFPTSELQLASGDLLLLMTDGITEARDGNDEEYGAGRLGEAARRAAELAPGEIVLACVQDLTAFRGIAPAVDDQTLMVLQRAG